MCGIVGYVGSRPAQEIILGGLRKLEYRGYDSAGMSLLGDGEIHSVRAVGNLDRLEAALAGRGRVLVRPSGTEPLVRVMVEAPSAAETDAVCARLVAVVTEALG